MKHGVKKICAVIAVLLSLTQIFCGCADNTKSEEKLLLTCVRADSGSVSATAAAGEVSAAIDYYLYSVLGGVSDYESAYGKVGDRIKDVELIANAVLRRIGIGYTATATLTDSLIIKLGLGYGGDTVTTAYPITQSDASGVRYKSIIADALR